MIVICLFYYAECQLKIQGGAFTYCVIMIDMLITGAHRQQFNDYLLNINKELSYVHFELRGCRNQYDGKVYYGVVNNVSDEQSKLGTKYTVPQLAFYKGIVSFHGFSNIMVFTELDFCFGVFIWSFHNFRKGRNSD